MLIDAQVGAGSAVPQQRGRGCCAQVSRSSGSSLLGCPPPPPPPPPHRRRASSTASARWPSCPRFCRHWASRCCAPCRCARPPTRCDGGLLLAGRQRCAARAVHRSCACCGQPAPASPPTRAARRTADALLTLSLPHATPRATRQMAYYDKQRYATDDAMRIGRLHTHLPGWTEANVAFMQVGAQQGPGGRSRRTRRANAQQRPRPLPATAAAAERRCHSAACAAALPAS